MIKIWWIQIFATVFQLTTSIAGLCNETNVGIRDELQIILDAQMTASTNNGSDFLPEFGRLHGAKAWCPETVPVDMDPYLQIDLGQTYVICAVEVQGLPDATLETNFTLKYHDGIAFVDYNSNQQFNGSAADGDVADFHELTPPITTQSIRFKPTSASICLRVEVYGTPEGVDVTCNENDMQVQINRGVHDGFSDPNDLSLKNSSCTAEPFDALSINFTITLGTCQTTVYISKDGVKSFYHNVIKNSTSDDFNIICSYIREPTQLATAAGSFSFAMNIFTDDTFQTPVPSGPISLSASLYFLIDVQSSDANTELHLTNCRATPSSNPLDPTNYTFIENGCDVESANDFITGYNCTKTDNNQTFVLSVFRFAGSPAGSSIYFHCDVIVCLISPNSVCTTQCNACSSGSRKRRDLGDDDSMEDLAEAHLLLGPYTIVDIDEDNDEQDDIDDEPEKEDQTETIKDSENFPVTLVVVVCVSAFVAMAIIAALLVTIRLSKNARGPAVKEVTADLARDNLGFDELGITTLSVKPNDKTI